MTKYTEEKIQDIIKLLEQGLNYKEVAEIYDTNEAALGGVLRRRGYKRYKKVEFDTDKFLELRGLMSYVDIAKELGVSYDLVKKEGSKLVKSGQGENLKGVFGNRGGYNGWRSMSSRPILDLPREELLNIVREYVSYEACPTHLRSNIKRIFGTWTNALQEAGISGNIGGKLYKDRTTRVYLLKFNEFYKVGVTQQQIKSRFSGAPSYEIVDYVETDLDNATYLEKELKKTIKAFQYIAEHPWFERNGKTECFIPPHPINALEEIFDL
jgi:hypothetical protein